MSTSEYRSVEAESDLPIGAAELAALANQLFATSFRPGPDSPPLTAPVAPRGSAPDATAAASAGTAAVGAANPLTPVAFTPARDVYVPAPSSPAPDGIPQTVPVAPRGSVPDTTAAPSAGYTVGSALDPYAVPTSGIVSTVPGVLAGSPPAAPVAPRGSAPSWPSSAPSVADLGWTGAPAAAPEGDEANYYFLSGPPNAVAAEPPNTTAAGPVPQLPDNHEVFDVNAVRADFPILRETVNGKPLIWFDNAATTQKPQAVIDRLAYFYAHENSNIHRAAHELAARATDAYESARDTVARFIGAGSSDEIVFVRGATEAINLVAQSWGRANIGAGDEIVISHLEHHANIVPWQQLAAEKDAVLRVIPVDDDGQVLLDEYQKLLNDRTKLVAVAQVSNALGTITPIRTMIEMAHSAGALALVDAAQSVPHAPVDVTDLDADFLVFSGHKVFGPTGIGVLYGKAAVLESMPPWQGGGNMIADVTLERSEFQGPPNRFEAGTGNIADAVGLGAALDYVQRIGMSNIAAYEHELLEYATEGLRTVPGLRIIGTAKDKASVLSFVLDGYEPVEVGSALNKEGIAVRAGYHCAQPILRRFGLEGTVRASLAFYNTHEEIDVLVAALRRLAADAGR